MSPQTAMGDAEDSGKSRLHISGTTLPRTNPSQTQCVRKWPVSPRFQNPFPTCRGFQTALQTILKPLEITMTDPVAERIQSHPKYLELKRERNRFGWLLTMLMLFVYYGYIALIAFNKPFLASPSATA